MAPTTGSGDSTKRAQQRRHFRARAHYPVRITTTTAGLLRSAPAQNVPPVCPSTTTRRRICFGRTLSP